jgi:hypothetical protein
MTDAVDAFFRLFRGRGDVIARWDTMRPAYGTVVRETFEQHLKSADQRDWIGVYPLLGNLCSWGCVDIDVDDLPLAQRLQGALKYKDVPAWIEKTDKGYHVWVFPEEPLVEATTMRGALMAACKAIGYEPREVNPKQTKAAKIGNWVRLPYNGWLSTHPQKDALTCRRIIGVGMEELKAIDAKGRAPVPALEAIAKLWVEPERNSIELGEAPPMSEDLRQKLSGRAYTIWKEGPRFPSARTGKLDRSETMVKLAHQLAADGLKPEEAFTVLASAYWNKYLDRPDHDEQVLKIVEGAYG